MGKLTAATQINSGCVGLAANVVFYLILRNSALRGSVWQAHTVDVAIHTHTHTHCTGQQRPAWSPLDLLPVRLRTLPVGTSETDPISGRAFNETQTETRFLIGEQRRSNPKLLRR